jgi:hypothetical protein
MVLKSNGYGILVSQCSVHQSVAPPHLVTAPRATDVVLESSGYGVEE